MLTTFRISVSLSQTKVNDVYIVLSLAYPNKEVIWLNVSVQEQSRMNILNPLDHLISKHKHCLQ